jgi:hypothetical protein
LLTSAIMTRHLGIGAFVITLLTAACSSTVETTGHGGGGGSGGGSGGGGSPPTCVAEAFPCCEPGQSDPCCADCNAQKQCGGIAGFTCAGDEYCDFANDQCGGDDGLGKCVKKPLGCDFDYQPTCGCDGAIHSNPCDAQSSGTDVSTLGGCKPPPGMFGCGAHFCTLGMEYCEKDLPSTSGIPNIFVCRPLPAACGAMSSCGCLAGEPCAANCADTGDGGQLVTCVDG